MNIPISRSSASPILVFRQNSKRESGLKAQIGNITAAKAVANIIRTTLGPKSMLKMILDPMGGIILTNDGATILREIEVNHPAAKSMIDLSRTQDDQVGDGTTSVIILAGEMLGVAKKFFTNLKFHPNIIIEGYHLALQDSIKYLPSISKPVNINNKEKFQAFISTTLNTKFVSRFGDFVSKLALEAAMFVKDKNFVDIKRFIRVEKIVGGELSESKVLRGIAINKDLLHSTMRNKIKSPRIMLLDCPLEYKKAESQTNIEMSVPEHWKDYLKSEEKYIIEMCKTIIDLKPDVLITEKGISDLAIHYLTNNNITALRRVRKTDVHRISKAVGANIGSQPDLMTEKDIGKGCKLFELSKIGDEFWCYLVDCEDPKACSVILRGGSKEILAEIERNLLDAMNTAKNLIIDPRVVPGGGAAELALASMLRKKDLENSKVIQPYKAVAEALEIIPKTLIQNGGGNVIKVLTELRAMHSSGKHDNYGVNGDTGEVADMQDISIWDPILVKEKAIKTAIDSATTLLKIGEILSGISKGKESNNTNMEGEQD